MLTKKKALSLLLSAIIGVAMLVALPSPAYADPPDLEFELWESDYDVSQTKVGDLEYSQSDSVFSIVVSSDPMSFSIGDKYPSYLSDPYTPWDVYPSVLAIGDYFAVLELEADGTLINYGQQEIDNSMLRKPYSGTTRIAVGIGKVTVSSYQVVDGCQLYLVPSGSLPAANGKINLIDSFEVTGNGDITGLATDTCTLYTVYTDLITDPAFGNYSHGAYVDGPTVSISVDPVCRIGSTNYPNIATALDVVNPGETITLLQSITESTRIEAATTFTIDLAGYNLYLINSYISVTPTGNLTITGGGSVTADDGFGAEGGTLSIEAEIISNKWDSDGIFAVGGARVTVSGNITVNNSASLGVIAMDDDTVFTITGNITTQDEANIYAGHGAKAYVTGNLICTGKTPRTEAIITTVRGYVELNGSIDTHGQAIHAYRGSEVYVKGNIDAGIHYRFKSSIEADYNSIVSVDGYVSIKEASDGNSIDVQGDSSVVIKGDLTVEGDRCNAIYAGGNDDAKATVNIGGSLSVTGENDTAIYAEAGGDVTVKGDVTTEGLGSRGVFVYAESGDASVKVNGSVITTGNDVIGIDCFYHGIATVGGNVVASGSDAIGVQVQYSSEVTIEDTIIAPTYISFGELTINGIHYNPYTKTAADNDSSSMKPDYMQYSMSYQCEGIFAGDYTDYVWVKNLEISTPDPGPGPGPSPGPDPGPGPGPNPSIPGTGDFDTLLASSSALLFALMGAGALLVSRRKVARAKR